MYKATLNKTVLTLGAKAGEGNRLFGSITGADIADAIKATRGFTIDKRKVLLEEPIVEAIKDGRGQVLALNVAEYLHNFNTAICACRPCG